MKDVYVVTVVKETDIQEFATLMSEKHAHLIPVLLRESIVGIIENPI
jgi:CBS domain-containing protein